MSDPNDRLVIDFVGEQYVVDPGDEITFGRQGDVVIDDNLHLHRILGVLRHRDGLWWLANVGSTIALQIADEEGPSFMRLAPGASAALSFPSTRIGFEAGGSTYELEIRVESVRSDVDVHVDVDTGDPLERTSTPATLPLSDDLRRLLVALAEPRLRPVITDESLPTNRQAAARLGCSITTFNRRLDSLCEKYSTAGVAGLQGSSDGVARDRRQRLVDYVLGSGIVTAGDLSILEPDSRN